jgi:hypothetical protein
MHHATLSPNYSPQLRLAAGQTQSPVAGLAAEFQQLYGLAMDEALGMERTSLTAALRLHSCMSDVSSNAFGFAPEFGNLLDAGVHATAFFLKWQWSLLSLFAPAAFLRPEMAARTAALQRSASSYLCCQTNAAVEEYAHSMDIAIGARAA